MQMIRFSLILLVICTFAYSAFLSYSVLFTEEYTIKDLIRLTISALSTVILTSYSIQFNVDGSLKFKHLTLLLFCLATIYTLVLPESIISYGSSYLFLTVIVAVAGLANRRSNNKSLNLFWKLSLIILIIFQGILIFSSTSSSLLYLIGGTILMIVTLSALFFCKKCDQFT